MHDVENQTPLGIKMELSANIDVDYFNHEDEDTYAADLADFEITCDAVGKVPFYHPMNSYIKEIAKCKGFLSDVTKAHIYRSLNNLLGVAVNSIRNELNKSTGIVVQNHAQKSNYDESTKERVNSLVPNHDKRTKDKRLKSYWEV